ncbi:MAG: ABC transporter substrate-binding protein [Anaerolineae bacterium]|jgi:peptide/nickel transport system substrate-binding protein|nr:ABC transporter substrate-binding protein [Anaerolineae bacterium]
MKLLQKFSLMAVLMALLVVPAFAQDPITFTFGEFGNPVQLDPAVVTDGISFRVTRQGCESLLEFEGGTTVPGPGLATSWEQSEDGLTWTFQLVEGATFHDGTPFNAEAVVFNFNRWRDTSNPYHFAEQTFEYYEAQFNGYDDDSIITNVEATGDFEVTFTLAQPMGAFLNNLAMPMFAISSPAAIEANGANYGTPEVGYVCTGPFRFVSWESDVQVVLERFAEYWGEFSGNVDRVVLRVIPDNAARFAALQNGEIDGFEQPNVEDIATIEASEDLYIQLRPSFNTFYLAFNYRIREFRDPLVREAFTLSIDRQAIVDAFYVEGAVPASTMNPPTIGIGFNPDIQQTFDPVRARELLAQAGFPDGLSEVNVLAVDENGMVTDEVAETIPVRLYYMPVVRPYNPDGEGIAEAMASMMAEAGINVELASAGDWATYLGERANGNLLGLYQLGWTGDNGDPDNFIGYFFSGVGNPLPREGFYQNTALADLLLTARTGTDRDTRNTQYQEAEGLLAADFARIFVAHGPVPLAFRSRVTNYITSPLGTELFKNITITE